LNGLQPVRTAVEQAKALKGKTVSNWTALKQGQSICNGIDFGQGSKILFQKKKTKKVTKNI